MNQPTKPRGHAAHKTGSAAGKPSVYDAHKASYWKAGYPPLPIDPDSPNGKACTEKDWQSKPRLEALDKINPGFGIGLRMGTELEDGTKLGVLDVDRDDIVRAVRALVRSPVERFGSKGGAIFVRVDPALEYPAKLKMHGGEKAAVELLFDKANCVIPPTIHPDTRKPYRWVGKPLLELGPEQNLPVFDAAKLRFLQTLVTSKHLPGAVSGEQTHDDTLRLVGQLVRVCDDDGLIEAVVAACFREDYAGDSLDELSGMIRSARKKIDSGAWSVSENTDDGRPVIMVKEGTLHEQVYAAEAALFDCAETPVYVRAGRLVHYTLEEADASRGRKTTVYRVSPLTVPGVRHWLGTAAQWVKPTRKGPKRTDPSKDVAQGLLAHGGWKLFQNLEGVVETPTLRPDLTVLSEPGYDPQTGLILVNPPPMPDVQDVPARADAEAALELLNELLDEFPFVDPASRSVALAALMTPVVRPAMKTAPLFVFTAPAARTGKSYLISTAAAIATGRECPVLAYSPREEETEKRLNGWVLSGRQLGNLDNVNGELAGDFLCQTLSPGHVQVRALGQNQENTEVEVRMTLFANGNNITIVGDLVERSIVCSLDANMEHPGEREFTKSPLETALTDRGKYVAAVLTIVRAYHFANDRVTVKPFNGFGDWSRLVREALVWLRCADPVATLQELRDEDPQRAKLSDFLTTWERLIEEGELSGRPAPAGDLCVSKLDQTLRELTGGWGEEPPSPAKVGAFLKKYKDSLCNGLRIRGETNKHAKVKNWWLEREDGTAVVNPNARPNF